MTSQLVGTEEEEGRRRNSRFDPSKKKERKKKEQEQEKGQKKDLFHLLIQIHPDLQTIINNKNGPQKN